MKNARPTHRSDFVQQLALVEKLNGDRTAQVSVRRVSACGHDCASCGACGAAPTLSVTAQNPLGARVGDLVRLETGSGRILGLTALTYLLPLLAFFLGYGLGALLFSGETGRLVCAGAGFLLGLFVPFLVSHRLGGRVVYTITSVEWSAEQRRGAS